MGKYPYRIQYFVCKEFAENEKNVPGLLKALQELDSFTGEVTGETGIDGLRLDFNCGLRLIVPEGDFHVRIGDYDSEEILFEQDVSEVCLISWEKYYIRWSVEVFLDGKLVLAHVFDPHNQRVHFDCSDAAMGDFLAFLPYIKKYREIYNADVTCSVPKYLSELALKLDTGMKLSDKWDENLYAVYYMHMGFNFPSALPIPADSRSLTMYGQLLTGLSMPELLRYTPTEERTIREPYVCIAVQASTPNKGWLWPQGWDILVDYLKKLGYRVLCIDRDKRQERDGYVTEMPKGAEDFTGDLPLVQRAELLAHADFFVGLSSGLAWLAHSADCPVVMIAGFTRDWYEFHTPYRVYNRLACNGCANDDFAEFIFDICPRHKGDKERELECQKKISPRMVTDAIERLRKDKGYTK